MNSRRKKKTTAAGWEGYTEVLNVSLGDTRRVRQARRSRILVLGFQAALVLVAAVVVVVMLRHAFIRAFVESDHFTLSRVEVETNGRLERAQVLAATGVREGANLLKLDLARIEKEAHKLPQVDGVTVERILPDALKITLRERVPVAWISCLPAQWRARTATSGLLADRDGHLFRCESLAPDLLGLTVIDLIDGSGIQPGGVLPEGPAKASLKLATELAESRDSALPRLSQIAVRNGYALEATLETGENAWLSPEEPVEDFHRLVSIVEHFQHLNQTIAFVNLLPRKNVAVRLAATDASKPVRRARSVPEATPVSAPATGRSSPEVRAILNRR